MARTTRDARGGPTPPEAGVAIVTALIADDRPMVRAGLAALLAGRDTVHVVHAGPSPAPTGARNVMIVVVNAEDPAPFDRVATVTALHENLRVLAMADSPRLVNLREGVIAGADSFLLTTAGGDEIADALHRTARGERVISPEFAMQLAESWHEDVGTSAASLTARELEVVGLLAEGMTNKDVAARLGLSARTVKTHVQNLLEKLDARDRTAAVAQAFRLGLIR